MSLLKIHRGETQAFHQTGFSLFTITTVHSPIQPSERVCVLWEYSYVLFFVRHDDLKDRMCGRIKVHACVTTAEAFSRCLTCMHAGRFILQCAKARSGIKILSDYFCVCVLNAYPRWGHRSCLPIYLTSLQPEFKRLALLSNNISF